MTKTQKASLAAIVITLAAVAAMPAADAFHGGWWRGRDLTSTSALFPNPGSTATSVLTGQVFDLDFQWGGGGGGAGFVTIEFYDQITGALVHSNTFAAVEDITSVTWVTCPFPNSVGIDLEIVPLYSLITPGVLSVGPGAPGGSGNMQNSFCNDTSVADGGNPVANDPLYYKAFSDYTGHYIASAPIKSLAPGTLTAALPSAFNLDIHVRQLDHA